MKHTKIEKLLIIIAWTGLIGGILFGALVSKGTLESGLEMCAPRAFFMFVGSVFISVAGWALLIQIVNISNRLRNIEKLLKEKKD
ncbi:MAG: hypothetical protein Q4F47_08185 [Bacteroidaceae bacterium]|nr:hypothetical protein [Bacteroidaceae bacterium]MDO5482999.1 hypothetical protein [Bacteroidaceae bacterium]